MSDGYVEYEREPLVKVVSNAMDIVEEEALQYVPPPVQEWCECGKCHGWPQSDMNVCCKHHPIWDTRSRENVEVACITLDNNITDLLKPAPLRLMYRQYCCHHPQRFPDATTLKPSHAMSEEAISNLLMKQRRLAAYRSLVFWTYPDIGKGIRKPLPSCVYLMIRAKFTTSSDEEFADEEFSRYCPESLNDE